MKQYGVKGKYLYIYTPSFANFVSAAVQSFANAALSPSPAIANDSVNLISLGLCAAPSSSLLLARSSSRIPATHEKWRKAFCRVMGEGIVVDTVWTRPRSRRADRETIAAGNGNLVLGVDDAELAGGKDSETSAASAPRDMHEAWKQGYAVANSDRKDSRLSDSLVIYHHEIFFGHSHEKKKKKK